MRKGPLLGPTVPLWLLLLGVTAAIPFADALAADKTAPPSAAGTYVIVARAVQGCFFDTVRVSGYLMPRQEMQIPFEAEGYRITEVSVGTGDKVTVGQQLAKLVRLSGDQPSNTQSANAQPILVKTPVAGTIIKTSAAIGRSGKAKVLRRARPCVSRAMTAAQPRRPTTQLQVAPIAPSGPPPMSRNR